MLRLLSSESEEEEIIPQVAKRKRSRSVLKLSSDEDDPEDIAASVDSVVTSTEHDDSFHRKHFVYGASTAKTYPCCVIKRSDVYKVKVQKKNSKKVQVGLEDKKDVMLQSTPLSFSVQVHTSSDQKAEWSQTECPAGDYKLLVPVLIPTYVPLPSKMFTKSVPVPYAVPLPIPIPAFLPTLCKNEEDFLSTCQSIKEEVSEDVLETELLQIAEAISTCAPPTNKKALPLTDRIDFNQSSALESKGLNSTQENSTSLGLLFVETATNESDHSQNNNNAKQVKQTAKTKTSTSNAGQMSNTQSFKPLSRQLSANVCSSVPVNISNPHTNQSHAVEKNLGVKHHRKQQRSLSTNSQNKSMSNDNVLTNFPLPRNQSTSMGMANPTHSGAVKRMQFPMHSAYSNSQTSTRNCNISAINYRDPTACNMNSGAVVSPEADFQGHSCMSRVPYVRDERFQHSYPTSVDLLEEAAASALMRLPRGESGWRNSNNQSQQNTEKKIPNLPVIHRQPPSTKHIHSGQYPYQNIPNLPENQQLVNLPLGDSYFHGATMRHLSPNDPGALNRIYLPTSLSEYQAPASSVFQMRPHNRHSENTPITQQHRYFDNGPLSRMQHPPSNEPVLDTPDQVNFVLPRFLQYPPR
ncbi:uncharacterized protein LOC100186789 isoform X1 [Ciona intestinalis]